MNLDDEVHVILDLARDTHDPSDDDRARVRAALASKLGVAAGFGLAVGVGVSAKAAATTGAGATAKALGAGTTAAKALGASTAAVKALGAGTAAAKLIGAVVLVSATVGVGATAIHRARHAPGARVAIVERTAPRSHHRSAPVAGTASTGMAAPASAPADENASPPPSDPGSTFAVAQKPMVAEAVQRARATAMASGAAPSARAVPARKALEENADRRTEPAEPRSSPAVADEARLIHAALMALRSGQRERALALFDEHAFRYPHGALAEERDAKRALVLAELGRTVEARTAIDHFLQAYPASPLAMRLRERLRNLDRP